MVELVVSHSLWGGFFVQVSKTPQKMNQIWGIYQTVLGQYLVRFEIDARLVQGHGEVGRQDYGKADTKVTLRWREFSESTYARAKDGKVTARLAVQLRPNHGPY